ncbi:hypothetical protein K4F52_010167 [Lecanicillium sp. MT-2017a]|nr:hypothetical protein K4F52_010167 [Lecanicillium sp. MT-2017a]
MALTGAASRALPPIWDKIFKCDSKWLPEMVELQEIKPSILPTLVGCGLQALSGDEDKSPERGTILQIMKDTTGSREKDSPVPLYLVLLVHDWSGDLKYASGVLIESLQSHKWVGDCEVSIVGTNIIVNISECLGISTISGQIRLRDPSRIFCPGRARRTKILCYGDSQVQDVGQHRIGGVRGRFSTSVNDKCSVHMKTGDGKPMYRVFVRDDWTTPVDGISITDENGRSWTTNWKKRRSGW